MSDALRAWVAQKLGEAREQQARALADANACAGAIQALEAVLAQMMPEPVPAREGA